MFKIGDKVRFVTTEPQYDAVYDSGELEIVYIYEGGDFEVSYPVSEEWSNGFEQTVHPDDVEHV